MKSLPDQFDEAGGEHVDAPTGPNTSGKVLRFYAIGQLDSDLLTPPVKMALTITLQQCSERLEPRAG